MHGRRWIRPRSANDRGRGTGPRANCGTVWWLACMRVLPAGRLSGSGFLHLTVIVNELRTFSWSVEQHPGSLLPG